MSKNQKELELHRVKSCLSNEYFNFLGDYQLITPTNDPPDIELVTSDKIISIELTDILKSKQKQIERFEEEIFQLAWNMFKTKYSAELYVLVWFSNTPMRTNKRVKKIHYAEAIFEKVEALYLANKDVIFDIDTDESVNQYIDIISVGNILGHDHWQRFGGYIVSHANSDWIQTEYIAKKAAQIDNYPKVYDSKWLIMSTRFGQKSSAFRFNKLKINQSQNDFDLILVHDYRANEIYELKRLF